MLYYINGFNLSGGSYPYTTVNTGAPNFKALLDGLGTNIQNGDEIVISGALNGYIDDVAYSIDIPYKLNIYGREKGSSNAITPVHLNNNTYGMKVTTNNVAFIDMDFYIGSYNNNVALELNGNGISLKNCTFSYGASTGNGASLTMYNSDGVSIDKCTFNIPSGNPMSYGIYADSCSYCKISNSIFNTKENAQSITFANASNNNLIRYNVIGTFDSYYRNNTAIIFGNRGNYNMITHNAICLTGELSRGVVYGFDNTSGKDVKITNNYIYITDNDFSSVGIFIPYVYDSTVSNFTLIENIIEYQKYSSILDTNDSIAINASIKFGIVDYNDIFGFNTINRFVNNKSSDIIRVMGEHTLSRDPRTVYRERPTTYPSTDIRRYYCDTNSECVGAGKYHHTIGISVNGLVYTVGSGENTFSNYVNIVDTVMDNYGAVTGEESTLHNFYNSVFKESAVTFDNVYRNGNGPYATIDENIYKNTFDFVLSGAFPFAVNSNFYNKDFVFVQTNKRDLAPFDDITCPTNPGHGYPNYVGYPTGLWGYNRRFYRNYCDELPCIIQDSYSDKNILKNTIYDTPEWIQNVINPPCLTATP